MNEDDLATTTTTTSRLPVVTIVGRPNAGKSTLFNRLVPGQRAIVDPTPGVTRDRNIAPVDWGDRSFLLVDTGGFEDREKTSLAESVRSQSAIASEESDAIVVLLDGRAGLHPDDRTLVDRVRRLRKPTYYAVNKLDLPKHEDEIVDFYGLGIEEIFPVSAAHGRGVHDLFDRVVEELPGEASEASTGTGAVRLAIIGRPNVGKSSLVNRLVGFERSVVDSTPGTTRDALDTPFRHGNIDFVLVDTAGIRRRPKVQEHVERSSVVRALRALEAAEIAVLVIDASEGITDQDARISGYAWERRRALVIAVNKIDLLAKPERDVRRFERVIAETYPTLAEIPVVAISVQSGAGLNGLFPALERVIASHRLQLQTAELNRALTAAVEAHAPPILRRKAPRFYYAAQTGNAPPYVTIFTNNPAEIAPTYERYLYNSFRRHFDLVGTPLQLKFRKRHEEERAAKPRPKQGSARPKPRAPKPRRPRRPTA